MMKRIFILILLISGWAAAQTHTLTLKESIELGLNNSKKIKIAESKINAAGSRKDEIGSQFLPQISFSASYARLSDIPPFEIRVPFSPTPITVQEPILNTYNFKLSLQQPLFTGFRLSSLKSAAGYSKLAAEEEYDAVKNEEAAAITVSFYNYYKSLQLKKAVNESAAALEKRLTDTKNFMDNGLVTNNDYLKIEVQLYALHLKKIEADNASNMAEAILKKLLGIPFNEKIEIKTEVFGEDFEVQDFNTLVQEAKEKRSDLKSLDFKIAAGEQSVTAASSGWYPSVSLFSNYYYNRPNQRIMPAKDSFEDTWDAGVMLSWEILNWGETAAQTRQAEENLSQIQLTKENVEEAVEIEVYNNYLKLISMRNKIELTEKSLLQAEENNRVTVEKYGMQLASSSDLLEAEAMLLQNKTEAVNALADYEIARMQLNKSAGRILY